VFGNCEANQEGIRVTLLPGQLGGGHSIHLNRIGLWEEG
jgi:hypothetical protein